MTTVNLQALIRSSYQVRREVEEQGELIVSTNYVPTDWSQTTKAEVFELMGGLDPERDGVCPKCFQIRSRAGACNCDDNHVPQPTRTRVVRKEKDQMTTATSTKKRTPRVSKKSDQVVEVDFSQEKTAELSEAQKAFAPGLAAAKTKAPAEVPQELIDHIRAFAHSYREYRGGGWDVIEDTWTDEQIAAQIQGAKTKLGAQAKMCKPVLELRAAKIAAHKQAQEDASKAAAEQAKAEVENSPV